MSGPVRRRLEFARSMFARRKTAEPIGKDTLLYFDTGSDRAFVVVTEGLGMSEVSVGARLGLVLDVAHLHLFDQSGRRIGCAA
jgi:hypothetical protein